MVLVDLAVDGSGGFLMSMLGNIFIHNRGSDLLMYSGVMVTSLMPIPRGLAFRFLR